MPPRLAALVLSLVATAMPSAYAGGNTGVAYAEVLRSWPIFAPLPERPFNGGCKSEGPLDRLPDPPATSLRAAILATDAVHSRPPASGDDCGGLLDADQERPAIVGYEVEYRYRGHVYRTRMPYDPGPRIPVRVDVVPGRD